MTNLLDSGVDVDIALDLPKRGYPILGHVANIDYCIEQLQENFYPGGTPVIGYFLEKALGTIETSHRVISEERARELKKINPRFEYIVLDQFLRRKEDIEKGDYLVSKGIIIDYNPSRLR